MKYKDVGVDIDKAEIFKNKIKHLIRKTYNKSVLTDIGLFGSLYAFPKKGYINPILVSSIDGVGTKTLVAKAMKQHEGIGYDVVSHCANDILAQGARPLFFLDYIGTSKLKNKVCLDLIKGMTKACCEVGCSLIGGETAQMPDVYVKGEYDLVGCIIGIIEKNKIIKGSKIKKRDILIGLKSNGLHTNGFTLARNVLLKKYKIYSYVKSLKTTIGKALLKPHKNYNKDILKLSKIVSIKGLAHITGGGLLDNIPRILPKGLGVSIDQSKWEVLPIYKLIQETGNVPKIDMYRTFNMGIGMVIILDKKYKNIVLKTIKNSYLIGEVVKKKGVAIYG